MTLETGVTPDDGFFVTEEAWADQISVGPIILTGVPISVAGRGGTNRWGAQYEGTLGLAVLKRLDLIVDSNKGVAYLRAKTTPPPAYPHNRLGAIFAATTTQTNQGVARVVDGGPAYEAGVRNGDVLLQVDEVTVRGWTDDWLSRFYMPAGTKLKLTLQRDGKIFTTTATLREILQPSPNKNK
jgi:S1-C subfamily serine protease